MKRASRRRWHFIYKTTCIPTGRYYVGMHSADDLNDRYLGSGKVLWNSIKKYGKQSHSLQIVEHLSSRQELVKREEELVDDELLKDEKCMNLARGGKGGWDFVNANSLSPRGSTEGRQKAAKKMLEWRIANNAENGFSKHHHSEETKKRISESMKRYKAHSSNG